ncbi:MAG TPA: sigma-54 dependent transcriptional regulator [Deltaproteobacteria bacterium]|jgi:two-component system NtrC family response regulator|nr:sigma-54 dependent transcriptional regulator [Deltaproteobacteria bacterium]HQI00266.1 sigma-54 dependent transcriptional regulator [Deltaproteobacteria bacterium]
MEERKRILVIDDDKLVCSSIANVSRTLGYNSAQAFTLEEGLDAVRADPYDIVFLDVRMPDGNGIDIIPQICRNTGSPEVIVITAYGDPDSVDLALSRGAWDYIEKPFSKTDLAQLLKDAVLYHESSTLPQTALDFEKEGIIGHSPGMKKCLTLLSKTLSNDASVLISGETGTGKELFARAIHNHSLRAGNDFVVVDCAALPPNLVESILFGHEKGSYTGADRAQHGLVTQAHKGTLFLDEVGELPLSIQKKFLRVLQEGKFRPIGKSSEVESDFRVISATNRDLEDLVQNKRFRKDLLFRLRSITIDLPPLRDRIDDIPDLTNHYLKRHSKKYGMKPKRVSAAFRDILLQYSWPGNVRELIHALESAMAVAHDSPILVPKHLPYHIHVQVKRNAAAKKQSQHENHRIFGDASLPSLKDVREEAVSEIEEQYLKELLRQTKSDIKGACKVSGLSRSRLYALLKKYEIS